MKKVIRISLLCLVALMVALPGCGAPGDPIVDDLYTQDVLPGTANTFSVGSEDFPYDEMWANTGNFEDANITGDARINGSLSVDGDTTLNALAITGETTFNDQIILDGDGRVWLEFRPDIDFESVRAHGVPTWVSRGVFGGFSLPIYAANQEELQFDICVPGRWLGPAWEYLQDVGDEPGGMAVYEDNLYIPCEADDNVWIYDGTGFAISGNVGDAPVYSCVYDGDLYVTCSGDDTVWVFDGTNWALSGNVGNAPQGMAVSGGDLYVACRLDDEIWRLSGGVWAVDPALGDGGVAGAVGDVPEYLAEYGGDLYVGCSGVDDDVWIRTGGAWAKDDDVDDNPQEFHEHDGDLYLNCENDDTIWYRSGGVWAICTNVQTDLGNAPIGLEEYDGDLFSACLDSIWADHHSHEALTANIPFWNQSSDFSAVTADEPMFLKEYDGKLYSSCHIGDGIWVYEGETAELHIRCWLSAAQGVATDAFRLYTEYENFTANADIVPNTGDDVIIETLTGVAAQYQSYSVEFPLDMTGVEQDDNLGLRLQRIASSDEIAGEIVIHDVGVVFKCDKIGSLEP